MAGMGRRGMTMDDRAWGCLDNRHGIGSKFGGTIDNVKSQLANDMSFLSLRHGYEKQPTTAAVHSGPANYSCSNQELCQRLFLIERREVIRTRASKTPKERMQVLGGAVSAF